MMIHHLIFIDEGHYVTIFGNELLKYSEVRNGLRNPAPELPKPYGQQRLNIMYYFDTL